MAYTPIPEGTEDWDTPLNAALTDIDGRVTTAQATADAALASAGAAPSRPIFSAPESAQESVIWAGTAGHPYSSVGAGGTFNLNDTSDFVVGSQSIRMTTDGAGTQASIGVFGGATMDMTDKIPVLRIKVTGQADALDFKVWIGHNSLTNAYVWNLKENPAAWPYLREGQWVRIPLPLGKATVMGSPNVRTLTDFQIVMFDDSTGPVVVQWNSLSFVPEAQGGAVITFTFDDNLASQWTTARPILDAKGWAATAYVIPGIFRDPLNPAYVNYFKVDEAKKLQNFSGWDIATHCDQVAVHNQTVNQGGAGANAYTAYTASAMAADMREAKNYLLNNGFMAADHFAYPQGAYDEIVRGAVSQYFASARGLTNPTYESLPVGDRLNLRSWAPTNATPLSGPGSLQEAVDKAISGGEWLIFTLHEVVASPSTSLQISTANFQALVDYIASKGVPVRTVSDVFDGERPWGRTVTLPNGGTQLARVNIPNDALTSSGPDRLAFYLLPNTRVFSLNEYGEARMRPALSNTVAARVFGHSAGSAGNVFEVVNSANTLIRFRVSETDAECIVPFKVANNYITINGVRHYTGTTDPDASAPNGSVWFDLTAKTIKVRTGGAWV